MDAEVVEVLRQRPRLRAQRQAARNLEEEEHPAGHEALRIPAADARRQRRDPFPRHLGARPRAGIERQVLDVEVSSQGRSAVPDLAGAAGADRLVHQVVAEHGRARGAGRGDRLPEAGLDRPAILLLGPLIPGRRVRAAIAAQPGHVEVEARLLGERQEPLQLHERPLVRPIGTLHEPVELEVDADHGRAQGPHFPEVFLDLAPLGLPVVLEEPPRLVVVVIEAPGRERPARLRELKALPVGRNPDPLRRRRAGAGARAGGQEQDGEKPRRRHQCLVAFRMMMVHWRSR